MLIEIIGDVGEHLGKEFLAGLAECYGVPVPGKAIDEVLGQIRPSNDPELAEEGQPAAVQPDGDVGTGPGCRLAIGGGALGLLLYLLSLPLEPLALLLRQVLKDRHMIDQPLVGRVEELAVRSLAAPSYRNELVQATGEGGVYRRAGEVGAFLSAVLEGAGVVCQAGPLCP